MFAAYKDVDASLLIRTDFTDDAKWALVANLARATYEGDFCAILQPVDDPGCDGMTDADIVATASPHFEGRPLFIVDTTTLQEAEHLILCLNFSEGVERSFRTIPSQLWGVENNLRLSNMDFEDFYDAVDSNGVFRGFK